MNDDEWAHWIQLEAWTLKEAILLLEEKDPKKNGLSFSDFFYKIEDIAIRANMAGSLQTISRKPLCHCMRKVTAEEAKGMLRPKAPFPPLLVYGRKMVENESSKEVGIKPFIFLKWANDNNLSLNQHLMSALNENNTDIFSSKPKFTKESAADKIRCQAIALCLWHDNPNLTINDIVQDEKIKRFGNGAQYTSKTLRKWVSVVDTRSPSEKTGRPKKKTSSDS